jgi:O-acetyl-ADP-ribose deacetylase (regulator of RNase III)
MIFQNTELQIVNGDITKLEVDAVVNASSKSLSGGGGVDGAMHAAAGPELFKACLRLGGCETGEAKITPGYNLPAKFVIHTVGPMYGQENGFEASYLEDCYKNTLTLADQKHITSIAFPSISTGIYRYPLSEAVPIALESTKEFLEEHAHTSIKKIIFVCFAEKDFKAYKKTLTEVFN